MDLNDVVIVQKAQLDRIENMLEKLLSEQTHGKSGFSDYYTEDEVCKILAIKKTTLFSGKSRGKIPFYKLIEGSSKSYYKKSEINAFIGTVKHKSNGEISQEAENYIVRNKMNK